MKRARFDYLKIGPVVCRSTDNRQDLLEIPFAMGMQLAKTIVLRQLLQEGKKFGEAMEIIENNDSLITNALKAVIEQSSTNPASLEILK